MHLSGTAAAPAIIRAMAISESVAADLLAKCGRRCCVCRRFDPLHLQVHHIIEKKDGGTDDPDNLIPVCLTCHSDAHTKTAMTRRFIADELKQHRDAVFHLVAEGKLHAGPRVDAPFSASTAIEVVMPQASRNSLSAVAVELLVKAARGNGWLVVAFRFRGFCVKAGGQPIIDSSEARVAAEYRDVIDQLQSARLIEPRGVKGDVYAVTHRGYLLADSLIAAGTTP